MVHVSISQNVGPLQLNSLVQIVIPFIAYLQMEKIFLHLVEMVEFVDIASAILHRLFSGFFFQIISLLCHRISIWKNIMKNKIPYFYMVQFTYFKRNIGLGEGE